MYISQKINIKNQLARKKMSHKNKQNNRVRLSLPLTILFYVVNLSAADGTVVGVDDEIYEVAEVSVDANATNTGGVKAVSVTDIFQGKTTVNRQMIEATPAGNGGMTNLLRTNSAVKFSNTSRQSTRGGEIDPSEVSINGAKSYQNNFAIDGMNVNNDLDPQSASDRWSNNVLGNAMNLGAFASQGVNLDSDFIDSIDVYDSDVSAKYGSFTGGVIDAKTRDPQAGFHGKFSMSHTRDSWTKFHVAGEMQEDFENSANESMQPHFQKYTTRLNLEGFLTDNFGLLFGYTNTRSKIPLIAFSEGSEAGQKINQRRNLDNYFLKGTWYATDRLTIKPSVMYAPQTAKVHYKNAKNSFQEYKSGGLTLGLDADYEFDFVSMKNHLGYSSLEASRDAEHEYRYSWQRSNLKSWGAGTSATEGGYGDIKQTQKTLNYKTDFDFNEFDALWATHKFIAGWEITKQKASYEIKNSFEVASNARTLNGATCAAGDYLCSQDDSFGGNGQYLRQKTVYKKGKIDVDMLSWALYLEDKMDFGRLTLRPGVRLGGDDYMDKKTLAPRFSVAYDVFDNENTVLTFGQNRYYGRNIFSYKLRDGRESLQSIWRRSPFNSYNTNWTLYQDSSNTTKFSQLDIPYDDETTYGARQKFDNYELGFKYIKRKGKDQILRKSASALGATCGAGYAGATNCYMYTNGGHSDTTTWNIALRTVEPLRILGASNTFEVSYNHFKTKTNATRNTSSSDSTTNDERQIHYDGSIIQYGELPATDYNRPWSIDLTAVTHIPSYGLTWSNFFSYEGSVDAIVRRGSVTIGGTSYDNYENLELGKRFNWDMRISYQHKLPKDMTAFINLDINNVLDKVNKTATESSTSTTLLYEAGRQFWLEAGLKW